MVREEKQRQRAYPCPHCLTGFQSPSARDRHVHAVHEKRRDHACQYCPGVAFGTASTLKAHISAIHLKIKRSRGAK